MPRYTFKIQDGKTSSDCPDSDVAAREATAIFADLARGIAHGLGSNPKWQIEVTDEAGKPIFRLSVLAETLRQG
jgi:hypothetical protein